MKRFREFCRICYENGAISGYICLLTSVGLLIASFFVPPVGDINSSVLQAVAELFAFATLWRLPNIIASINHGKSLTVQHGNTSVTVASDKEEEEEK